MTLVSLWYSWPLFHDITFLTLLLCQYFQHFYEAISSMFMTKLLQCLCYRLLHFVSTIKSEIPPGKEEGVVELGCSTLRPNWPFPPSWIMIPSGFPNSLESSNHSLSCFNSGLSFPSCYIILHRRFETVLVRKI